MGKVFNEITPELAAWLSTQRMFFVASAPLSGNGLVNCSPKGMDTFRVLGPREVAYLDLTGSGIETIAHLRENGRIVFMFCAFEGAPKIVRLHGRGELVTPESLDWKPLQARFPEYPGARAIVRASLLRISDSCGYAVPLYEYREQRDQLIRLSISKGDTHLQKYRNEKNARSVDGLPGLPGLDPKP
ncbi:MAG: pyridoxamine 5'-phosphate oxidase family protein [Nitrospiraceae bacterium]